jgi:hypothetical protein
LFQPLDCDCKRGIALLKPGIAKGALQKLNKNTARAPKEFRLSFFASTNKQVQKKHRNSEEPPFAIRGAGDTLPACRGKSLS